MTREVTEITLSNSIPGTQHTIYAVRYGTRNARPKAYIHAGLHADEAPGLLVAHHLLEQLDAAEASGQIRGQIVVMPYANPLGLSQFINGDHLGRFDLSSGQNFNRNWPDIAAQLSDRVETQLGDDEAVNSALIREEIASILNERAANREVDSLYLALAREAFDSDLVLDLHCDDDGLMHMFVQPDQQSELADLAADLQCRAVFVQGTSGGATFAEACAGHWLRLAADYPERPIPLGCTATTIELRGFADIDDSAARADATAIVSAFRRRGYLDGPVPAALQARCTPVRLEACDVLRTPAFGVVVYRVELGENVVRDQAVADVVFPAVDGATSRITVRARTDGTVITRRLKRTVIANQVIAKIAGEKPLDYRTGYLLED